MDIKYYVRTTLDRELDITYNQIPYSLIVDKEYKPIDSFINALYEINDTDSFLLEDDLILCNNFVEETNKVLEKYPNRIINFFQCPLLYKDVWESCKIIFNQCTFYPKGLPKKIADIMITEPRASGIDANKYSLLEKSALEKLDIKLIQYRPHLVQHLDMETMLFNCKTDGSRRSTFFIDYLNEAGITYEEAPSHQGELCKLMQKHFRSIAKRRRESLKDERTNQDENSTDSRNGQYRSKAFQRI